MAFRDYNQALPGVGDPSTWAPYQDRRRLAPEGITGAVRYTSSDAVANYNGLQVSMRRRRANGFEFLASYTLSKSLGDNPGFYGPGWGGYSANSPNTGVGGDGNYNSYDMMLDYGPLWFASKHNLSLSGAYELPIGKGRKIGTNWKRRHPGPPRRLERELDPDRSQRPPRHHRRRMGPGKLAPEQRVLVRAARPGRGRRSRRPATAAGTTT